MMSGLNYCSRVTLAAKRGEDLLTGYLESYLGTANSFHRTLVRKIRLLRQSRFRVKLAKRAMEIRKTEFAVENRKQARIAAVAWVDSKSQIFSNAGSFFHAELRGLCLTMSFSFEW